MPRVRVLLPMSWLRGIPGEERAPQAEGEASCPGGLRGACPSTRVWRLHAAALAAHLASSEGGSSSRCTTTSRAPESPGGRRLAALRQVNDYHPNHRQAAPSLEGARHVPARSASPAARRGRPRSHLPRAPRRGRPWAGPRPAPASPPGPPPDWPGGDDVRPAGPMAAEPAAARGWRKRRGERTPQCARAAGRRAGLARGAAALAARASAPAEMTRFALTFVRQ